ncbi:MAG TPA: GAF domain-containing sensor histidine kinase [Ktedonobacterales bacterium]|nr:GAF domain-containing sensor histidine kinase [Ktedonobacterales bacterium]
MSISAREVAVLVQGLCYLILTISTARQFIRKPGQLRLHILLLFIGMTGSTLLLEASIRLYALASYEAAALVILHFSILSGFFTLYAAFLLAGDLTNIRPWLKWVGLSLLLLSAVFIVMIATDFPNSSSRIPGMAAPILPAAMLTILCGGFLFLSARVWYSSALASSASRRRLQLLGASATLAALGVAVTLERLFAPGQGQTISILARLLLLSAGIVLYLGCVPPGWLRRSWVLPELEEASRFCNSLILGQPEASSSAAAQGQTPAINQILQHAMNGFGALVGTVQLWNEARGTLEVAASILPREEGFAADAKSAKDEALAEVFRQRQALLRPISARKWPFLQRQLDAGVLLVVPLKRGEQTLGVLGVCCEHAPGFDASDLERLQLFADQITCLLTCHYFQEQMAAFQALRSERALKDEFIALIAHDLRTPLTVLKGRLQLLRRQLLKDGQPEAAEAVTKLDAPYNRLGQLISTLLDVSYIDTGRLQLLHQTIDLVGLVRKVIDANPEREITLELELGESENTGRGKPLLVQADAGRLEQVLSNLLDNARKYSPIESEITVRVECRAEGAEALVSVRDLGIGIPVEDQAHLFERWFRATRNPAQSYAGLGLGLYISHEIVSRHGGHLWVESSGIPGEGSTFFFTLPLEQAQEERAAGDNTAY